MTDAERKAMEWLDTAYSVAHNHDIDRLHRDTLKAMPARPALPKEPSEGMLDAMISAWSKPSRTAEGTGSPAAYRALYAHLSAPPKMSVTRALCIAKTLKGDGQLGDALRTLAAAYVDRHGDPT